MRALFTGCNVLDCGIVTGHELIILDIPLPAIDNLSMYGGCLLGNRAMESMAVMGY
jgi:hypothetical protein